jgi:WD40 repeat protein
VLSYDQLETHHDIGTYLVGRLLDWRVKVPAIRQLTDAIVETLPGIYPVDLESAPRLLEQAGDFSIVDKIGESHPEYLASSANTPLKVRIYRRLGNSRWWAKVEGYDHDQPTTDNTLQFSQDGHWLSNITPQGEVQIWDAKTHLLVKTLSLPTAVSIAAFSPDNSKLLCLLDGKSVFIWDRVTDTFTHTPFDMQNHILPQLAVFGDHDRVYITSANTLTCYKIGTRKPIFVCQFSPTEYQIISLRLSHDRRFLLTAGATPRSKIGIEHHVFSAQTGKLLLNTSLSEQELKILSEYPSFFSNGDGKLPLPLNVTVIDEGSEDERYFIFDAIWSDFDIYYISSITSGYGRYITATATSPCTPVLAIRDTAGLVGIFRYFEGRLLDKFF